METEADKIRKHYNDLAETEVKKLQDGCAHARLSDWMDVYWAIGHPTGYQVQVCVRCGKKLHRRTGCHECGKTITDGEIIEGSIKNGATIGGAYCKACIPKVAKKNRREMARMQKLIPELKESYARKAATGNRKHH